MTCLMHDVSGFAENDEKSGGPGSREAKQKLVEARGLLDALTQEGAAGVDARLIRAVDLVITAVGGLSLDVGALWETSHRTDTLE